MHVFSCIFERYAASLVFIVYHIFNFLVYDLYIESVQRIIWIRTAGFFLPFLLGVPLVKGARVGD